MVEDRSHFRAGRRQSVSLRIRYRAGSALEHDATTADLSLGGAFVETPRPPTVGTRVVLVLTTPTAWDPLEIPCSVRWVGDGSDGRPLGFGVKFRNLSAGQASALHELIQAMGYAETEASREPKT